MMVELILILVFIILTAWIDYEHIKKRQYFRSHASRWLQRLVFSIAIGLNGIEYFFGSCFMFIAIFDQVLNTMNGLPLFYIGTEAFWDKMWKSDREGLIFFKVICLSIALVFFFT